MRWIDSFIRPTRKGARMLIEVKYKEFESVSEARESLGDEHTLTLLNRAYRREQLWKANKAV